MGIIYKATNKINDNCYIGKTIQNFNTRKTKHKHEYLKQIKVAYHGTKD